MLDRNLRTTFLVLSTSILVSDLLFFKPAFAQASPVAAQLKIGGAVYTPLTLTATDQKGMPRTTVDVANPHENKSESYEGVLLEELLRRAGVAQGDQLRGKLMATCLIAESEGSYKVVFALAELDSGILNSEILVANTLDGAPIDAKRGPLRLIARTTDAQHAGSEC